MRDDSGGIQTPAGTATVGLRLAPGGLIDVTIGRPVRDFVLLSPQEAEELAVRLVAVLAVLDPTATATLVERDLAAIVRDATAQPCGCGGA